MVINDKIRETTQPFFKQKSWAKRWVDPWWPQQLHSFYPHIRPLIALMVKKSFRGFTCLLTLLLLCWFVCHFLFNSLLANFKVSLSSLISALSCSIWLSLVISSDPLYYSSLFFLYSNMVTCSLDMLKVRRYPSWLYAPIDVHTWNICIF